MERGLKYVNDLLEDSGNFLGYGACTKKFGIGINFVDFYSLNHSLPRPWRKKVMDINVKLDDRKICQKVLVNVLNIKCVRALIGQKYPRNPRILGKLNKSGLFL